jgi:hypothetical protein
MDTKQILWVNVQALMTLKFGEVNLYKTTTESAKQGKDKAISLGSLQRIKACETAIGIDVVDKIASFFEIEAWQLLVPNLDPSNLPLIKQATQKELEFYERIKAAAKDLVQN